MTAESPYSYSKATGKQFAVALRCESGVVLQGNECIRLPRVTTDDGSFDFGVSTEYRPFGDGTKLAAHHLQLRTFVTASTPGDALYAAQKAATILVDYLAFAHNAFIAPPMV